VPGDRHSVGKAIRRRFVEARRAAFAFDQEPCSRRVPHFSTSRSQGTDLLVEKIIGEPDEAHRKLRAHQSRNPRAGEGSPAFGGALRGARAQSRAGARLADVSAWPLLRSAAARVGIADTS